MDTKTLFQSISRKMRADFEASAQVQHAGSKGTIRENILRAFLAKGRLPEKYGVGSGEIVGRTRDTSRQCDLIVYDKLNGVTLLYDEAVQVFPIDCVYGIIEVKSSLSKAELLDALEKVRALKGMAPGGSVQQAAGAGWSMIHSRPKPFGMIFAYNLADNSLESLRDNLREWEAANPPTVWPNYICVLETGVIYHSGKVFEMSLGSDQITPQSWPLAMPYGGNTLFQFFCSLHDICAAMQLGPVELNHYYDPPLRIGRFVVYGRGMEGELARPGLGGTRVRIRASTIERVLEWCAKNGRMKYGDVLVKRIGSIPMGMEDSPLLKREVYLYNPANLPGLHEIDPNSFALNERGVTMAPSLMSAIELLIDNQLYVIAGLTDADYEPV